MKKQKENRLVVANAGWGKTIPEDILNEVRFERMALGLASNIKPISSVGDMECLAYLYTASLVAPMSHDMSEIYIYLTAKMMKRKNNGLPDFMEEKLKRGLTPDQERELDDLKRELYRVRGGEIQSPILNVMRELRKDVMKGVK